MNDSTPTADPSRLNARELFVATPDSLQAALERVLGDDSLSDSLPAEPSATAKGFVVAQAARALDEILEGLEVGALLMAGWNKLDDVRELIDETRRDGSTRQLTLASHTVASAHRPKLDIVVNKASKTLLEMTIDLGFTVDACDLVVAGGEVTGAEIGSLRAHGEISAHDQTIVRRESGDVDPKRLFGAPSAT